MSIEITTPIIAAFEILLSPFYELLYIFHSLSSFLFRTVTLRTRCIGMKSIVSNHSKKSKRERRDKSFWELTLAVSKNSSCNIFQFEPVGIDLFKFDFWIDLLSKIARDIFNKCKLKIEIFIFQLWETF